MKELFNNDGEIGINCNEKPYLYRQKVIDIIEARDFWCAFLIKKSMIQQLSIIWKKTGSKDMKKANHELYIRKDSMEEAYKCAYGRENLKDFNVRKAYLQHVLQHTFVDDKETMLYYPIWWLLGDANNDKNKMRVEMQREVYQRNVKQNKLEEGIRVRRDSKLYSMSKLRKDIVSLFNDNDVSTSRGIIMQLMSMNEHASYLYSIYSESEVNAFYDTYLWIQELSSYLLLVYDENDFINALSDFREGLHEAMVSVAEYYRSIE